MAITQTEQNLILQKTYILGTGSFANSTELAQFNGMIGVDGGFNEIDTIVNNYLQILINEQGVAATVQAIAKNGFGVTLSRAQAELNIAEYAAMGIDSGSKLLTFLLTVEGNNGATLDNRAEAATDFLSTLSDAGKSADFIGLGVTNATYVLLQNIDNTSASLANGIRGFDALSTNLSSTGITGTLESYLNGATVFADANRDGILNPGEWFTTTNATGTFEIPNSTAAGKIIVFGGTDLLTGNPFQGVLSSSTGGTVINPITTLIEAMVASGEFNSVHEATTALKSTLGLPANINLLSYNPLAVLSSSSATQAEKDAALSVQKNSQKISNIITQTASVIDTATAGATLQSAAAATTIALAQAFATAAKSVGATIDLANTTTLAEIIQASFTATGSSTSAAQIAQITQVTAGSNASADAATTITMLAQAADVAQGSATNALIAGATSGSFSSAVSNFTGTSLTAANYSATVGSIAPGVTAPATVSQNLAADSAAAAAAAALVAPTVSLSYSTNAGVSSSTTVSVKDADTLRIIATFDKAIVDGTPTITINNGILTVAAVMTKTDTTHYYYDLNVPAGDIAVATVTIGGARTSTSNTISTAPSNGVFEVDNTVPSAPTAVTLTPVGGTVLTNTLNTTNTNLSATATISAGEATGGSAVLKIGTTTIATDSTILAGDTSVTFNLNTTNNTALKAAIAAGGIATITLSDAAGNSAVSTVGNPTLVVDYVAPTAPTGVALTPVGGTVIPNSLNNTNTNLTAVATIVAGQATGGSAVLKIGTTTIGTDATIGASDTTVTFDLSPADNAALQLAVAEGGVATVTLIDANGNATVSSLSNPTLAVDYNAAFVTMTTVIDTISGSGSNDVFSGTRGDGAGPYTFNVGDTFDGLGGSDTLNITTGAEANTPSDDLFANISNFEKVIFNSTGNGAQSITTGTNFNTAFVTNGVDLTVQTLLGAIDVTMTTFTGTAKITTTTIGDGAHTITTGSGATVVNATGISAGAQTINGVGLTDVTATINGAGNQVIGTTNGGNLVNVTAAIIGAGSQTITSTSNSNVTIVAAAASGAQTITTAGGNDKITTTGAAGQSTTITTGAGNDVIIAGLSNDLITAGTGADTMTGGGGVDTFAFGSDGSVIGQAMDIITDFNTGGADILSFAAAVTLLTADSTDLVAGTNVNTTSGGLISFHASDDTFSKKVAAVQADTELDVANSVAMFVDGGNTYVYYSGTAAGNADDQLIQLTGITTLTTMVGGATLTIS